MRFSRFRFEHLPEESARSETRAVRLRPDQGNQTAHHGFREWGLYRVRRDHGLWAGRFLARPRPRPHRPRGRGDRSELECRPAPGPRLPGPVHHRRRLRSRCLDPRRNRACRGLRRGVLRRQLQHHLRAGGPRDLRHRARGRAHLRRQARRGLRAPGHPHHRHRAVDHRPLPAHPGLRSVHHHLARPHRHRRGHRGPAARGVVRALGARARGRHRRTGGVHHPVRAGRAAQWQVHAASRRPGVHRRHLGHRRRGRRPGRQSPASEV